MNKSVSNPVPEYELKHRLTGAIIMVMLAVVVIPLLLSQPSLEANNDGLQTQQSGNKTFRSKIVPLNINNVNGNVDDIEQSETIVIDDSRPALLDLTKSQPAQQKSEESSTKTALVMTQEPTTAATTNTSQSLENQKKPKQEQAPPATNEKQPEKVAKIPEEQDLEGWVVRVGTFSKKANVDSISSMLTNSGFKPKTTSVSTSLGPSTRVWLGPYAKRETA
ncbi:MAG: SPOR domain-containing protein, partial [Arenicellales bacterium]